MLSGKESACSAGNVGSIPASGRSPGERNGNPLQDYCSGNPTDRGAWRAAVHGVSKELDTTERLNNNVFLCVYINTYSFACFMAYVHH